MVDQKAVAGGRRIFDNSMDFAIVELEAHMTVGVFVQCDSALEWSITHHDRNIVLWALAEYLVYVVHAHAGNGGAINLQYLIAEAETRRKEGENEGHLPRR